MKQVAGRSLTPQPVPVSPSQVGLWVLITSLLIATICLISLAEKAFSGGAAVG